jgi:hypothetical protein
MRRLTRLRFLGRVSGLFCALALVFVPAASAAMLMTYEYFSNGLNPNAPTWCYHEDSIHRRVFDGTLAAGESFTVTMRYCTFAEFTTGPGGEGAMYRVVFWAGHQSVDLHIVFPDGTVKAAHLTQPGVLSGCVMPYVQEENNVIRTAIPSGTYQVVVTNTGSKAISATRPLSMVTWADMGWLEFQRGNCPVEDQNIGPIF